jgi:iron complex outermembrane receptor protein
MSPAWATSEKDPTWLSLEELMSIEISSAAKRPQRLVDATTAIYAIGRDEIRRSGATNLPELLRAVPGVQVSRIDASRYAVSIRGFSNRYSGKLLVLQDGRSLYNPLFSGTYWEAQGILLEDIERVEVIRGSGGTLWGANAVNGVINIITRHARESKGTHIEAKAGNLENGLAIRHGTALGDDGHLRAYAKVDQHSAMDGLQGQNAHDAWKQARAGFRADININVEDALTVQGDVYDGKADQSVLKMSEQTLTTSFVPDTVKLKGANMLVRWAHQTNAESNWHLQAYLDHAVLSDTIQLQTIDTQDLEWQQRLKLTAAQDLTWGLGMRRIEGSLNGGFTVSSVPPKNTSMLYSGFVQDEIQLHPDVQLTLGSKIEHNDNTGTEVQPSARMLWRASPAHSFWAAVSRAVQTPTTSTTKINGNVGSENGPFGPMVLNVRGNPDVQSETMLSREIGYRGQFGSNFNLDATAFYNTYDKVVSREFGTPEVGRYITLPINFHNGISGKAYGVELVGNWQVMSSWRLHGSYSWLNFDLKPVLGGSGIATFGGAAASPRNMVQVHSVHNLSKSLELDAHLYFTDKIAFGDARRPIEVPATTQFDLRVGWRATPSLDISITGRNLLKRRQTAYMADDVLSSQIPRSVLAQIRWAY